MASNSDQRPNNPRVFAETISLDAWRTPFDGEKGEADLHLDVVFSEGRIGGGNVPVRFRMSLRRAEVYVILDAAEVLKVPPSSVKRSVMPEGKRTEETKKSGKVSGKTKIGLSETKVSGNLEAEASGEVEITEKFSLSESASRMKVIHRKTENGYAFSIEPNNGRAVLDGQPWDSSEVSMKLRDTKFDRKRGEPPEPRIEIQCLREDLRIDDVGFSEGSKYSWKNLSRNKRAAVEQYIKDELTKFGFPCGDISDPFTRIVLSDAMPVEES